jgi:hypothetical protein
MVRISVRIKNNRERQLAVVTVPVQAPLHPDGVIARSIRRPQRRLDDVRALNISEPQLENGKVVGYVWKEYMVGDAIRWRDGGVEGEGSEHCGRVLSIIQGKGSVDPITFKVQVYEWAEAVEDDAGSDRLKSLLTRVGRGGKGVHPVLNGYFSTVHELFVTDTTLSVKENEVQGKVSIMHKRKFDNTFEPIGDSPATSGKFKWEVDEDQFYFHRKIQYTQCGGIQFTPIKWDLEAQSVTHVTRAETVEGHTHRFRKEYHKCVSRTRPRATLVGGGMCLMERATEW